MNKLNDIFTMVVAAFVAAFGIYFVAQLYSALQ